MFESSVVAAFAVGLLVLCIVGKVISLPLRLFWRLIYNSIVGALMLCIVNFFGLGIKITFLKALIAGVFGIPGVLGIVIFHFM